MTQYNVTISRAHKIAERLGQRATEARERAEKLTERVSLQGYADAQVQRLATQGSEAMCELQLMRRLMLAQGVVRAAIGRANAVHGVGDALARIEANKKVVTGLRSVLGKQDNDAYGATTLAVDDLRDFKPLGSGDGLRATTVSVKVLDAVQTAEVKLAIEHIERENFTLGDSLADLNGKTLSLEFEDEIATAVGLK